jgi:hypothetical protein
MRCRNFDMQRHSVAAFRIVDDEPGFDDFRMALEDGRHLRRVHEHPFTLVVWSARPIHPLMRALVRPQGLLPGRNIERSPVPKRISGYVALNRVVTITSPTSPGATDRRCRDAPSSTSTPSSMTSPSRAVRFVGDRTQGRRSRIAGTRQWRGRRARPASAGERLSGEQRLLRLGNATTRFVRLVEDDLQKRRRADIAIRLQIRHCLHLLLGLPCATWEHVQPERMCAALDHRACRREMVGKSVVDEIASTEPAAKRARASRQ